MASFRKRKSGHWQLQVRNKGYPTQTKSFGSKAAASQWARSIEYEMDQGLFISRTHAENTTIAELLERYLRERTVRKKGAESEACRIRALLRHPLAESIIGLYKTEVIRSRGAWRNVDEVEYATLEWVVWFNNKQLLGPIGNIPPAELEKAYYEKWEGQAIAA